MKTLAAVRGAVGADRAHQLIRAALPGPLASVMKDAEIESLRQRLEHVDVPPDARFNARDFAGAFGVFLLVFLSTFPVDIPFLIMRDVHSALRMSNLTAGALLFATGWMLGRYAGRGGFETLAIAIVLVALTMALGG